jgi:hypothetical protein
MRGVSFPFEIRQHRALSNITFDRSDIGYANLKLGGLCPKRMCRMLVCQALYGLGTNQGDSCDAHSCASFASMVQESVAQSLGIVCARFIIGLWSAPRDVVTPGVAQATGPQFLDASMCGHALLHIMTNLLPYTDSF